jgi:hypothetical protein
VIEKEEEGSADGLSVAGSRFERIRSPKERVKRKKTSRRCCVVWAFLC